MDDFWDPQYEPIVEQARALIKASCFLGRDPEIEDEPLGDLFDLVLHQGTPSPALFRVLDDLCAILPYRPEVLPGFFGTLLIGFENVLGHPRWTHPLIDDYRYVDDFHQLIHHHLIRLAPVCRTYLRTAHPDDRVAAASLVAYASREHPDVFAEYWDAATTISSPDPDTRPTILSGLKCFPPQPDHFDTLAAFVRDQRDDPWSAFAVECVLFHWGAYTGDNVQTRQALGRLNALQSAWLGQHPFYAMVTNPVAQVARGSALTDPMERWAGWAPFLPDALLNGNILGKIAFDLMGDPHAAEVLTQAFLKAVDTRPGYRDDPGWNGLTGMLQHHGMILPERTSRTAH